MCLTGTCQPLQLWGGAGTFTLHLVTDSRFLYFHRSTTSTTSALSRIAKDGSQPGPENLTAPSTSIGGALTIANDTFYWAREEGIVGCPLPSCGTPNVQVVGPENGSPFTNLSRTTLFWLRESAGAGTIMADVRNATALATSPGLSWVAADNSSVYFLGGPDNARKVFRVPSTGGAMAEVGAAKQDFFRLAVNSRNVFTLGDTDPSDSAFVPGVLRYSTSQTGQTPQVLGYDVGSSGASGGIAADEAAVYWIDLGDTTVRILKCSVAGCGSSPTVLAETRVDFPDAGLTIDESAVYWATDRGLYKIRKD